MAGGRFAEVVTESMTTESDTSQLATSAALRGLRAAKLHSRASAGDGVSLMLGILAPDGSGLLPEPTYPPQ
jgi:hypothetical protein